jgi:hypothetical protein
LALLDNLIILVVDPEKNVFGSGAASYRDNKVGFPDGSFEVLGPGLKRSGNMVNQIVAGIKVRAFLNIQFTEDFSQAAGSLINQAFLALRQTGRRGDKTDLLYLNPVHSEGILIW